MVQASKEVLEKSEEQAREALAEVVKGLIGKTTQQRVLQASCPRQ